MFKEYQVNRPMTKTAGAVGSTLKGMGIGSALGAALGAASAQPAKTIYSDNPMTNNIIKGALTGSIYGGGIGFLGHHVRKLRDVGEFVGPEADKYYEAFRKQKLKDNLVANKIKVAPNLKEKYLFYQPENTVVPFKRPMSSKIKDIKSKVKKPDKPGKIINLDDYRK